jgi:muramidase (phage lysozyme)
MARLDWREIDANERAARNVIAGLETLARCEGTWHRGDDGYNILVGGKFFDGYAKHPNILVDLPKLGIRSSAAGRYQFLNRTWVGLGLPDFSPENQDRGAIIRIRQRGGLDALKQGLVGRWIDKCCAEWASLPGAGYGQHEYSREQVIAWYQQEGGQLYSFANVQAGVS